MAYGFCAGEIYFKGRIAVQKLAIYIHGKGGSAAESEHYATVLKEYDVIGLDYKANDVWQALEEFPKLYDSVRVGYDEVIVIANSIGAYYTMQALWNRNISKAFFISPIVNMEKLISDMMMWANVTEDELREKKLIETSFGETLSWEYLCYARESTDKWAIPTDILYGTADNLTSLETVTVFADKHNASLTIMENGEHRFHTDEQMRVVDEWIIGDR